MIWAGFMVVLPVGRHRKKSKKITEDEKMPYDANLDKTLWEEKVEVGDYVFEVKVMQYNEGTKKINIQRFRGEMFNKLGRVTPEEAEAIMPLLQKAIEEAKK